MHPSLEYALVGCIAAIGSFLCTPLARLLATRWGAVAKPRDRDVHAVDTPRLGGLALLAGLGAAVLFAHSLPTLQSTFLNDDQVKGVLLGCLIISALGVLDDRYELDSLTKFAGQICAAGVASIVGGIQVLYVYVPGVGAINLDRDTSVELAILLIVVTINAVNFIDGLDGLAAGVTAIEGIAFFAYSYHLAQLNYTEVAAAPTLLCAALVGSCIGFLPHNFAPARIFMGDSGSMLVGLVLSASAISASSQTDPQSFSGLKSAVPLYLPLVLPLLVLALPLGDLVLAVLRRLKRGQSPFAPDKEHLHHRLMRLGHSHRHAVLLLYFWSAVLAFGAVAMSVSSGPWLVVAVVGGLLATGILVTAVPRLRVPRQ